MPCPRCLADPQPANFGSQRHCAFDDEGDFDPNNWNCATLTALLERDINHDGCDESMQIVPANGCDYGGWIVVTRYKHRGKASSAVHVGDFWPPQPLTLKLAEATIKSWT